MTENRANLPVLTVGEISRAIRSTLEDGFDHVRVRGEISNFKRHGSGHLYFSLKDHDAVIDGCCWRMSAIRLAVAPEDGLEVVCTGRVTTYPGRSKYQLIVESIELAGQGALLKLLEDRRVRLAAEGLFDAERKKPLPYLPDVVGVVTSPTGAVVRDILHRLRDRFPRRVLLWPVAVQGEGAAAQVARAIAGFNALSDDAGVPRPDVLIVGRGGGSLEDLWAFNEEVVVRAIAASAIPVISAVGHETDTTLADFAADKRAPTPSAAAEMAVPVRSDLIAAVQGRERRLVAAAARLTDERGTHLDALARGLRHPAKAVEDAWQRLDDLDDRLRRAVTNDLERRASRVGNAAARLRHPREVMSAKEYALAGIAGQLMQCARAGLDRAEHRLLRIEPARLPRLAARAIAEREAHLTARASLLESYSFRDVLRRGFALVHSDEDFVTSIRQVEPGGRLAVEFFDGKVGVTADTDARPGVARPRRRRTDSDSAAKQGLLF